MKPLDQYETPETDAMELINRYPEYHEGATKYVDREKCRSLERRLAACREALHQIRDDAKQPMSMRSRSPLTIATKTLTLTAP